MYEQYFGLKELPFSIAPDPSYLYMSGGHREALSHLLYGIRGGGGFILLTGEVGAGKTTLCRCLLEQVPPNIDIAFVLNPKLSVEELLATVCDDLGIGYPKDSATVKTYVDAINSYLLDAHARGRSTIIIIEEAQNLSFDVLEQLRLLTNLETDKCKLLQIILIGQPELLDMISMPQLTQLAQRITARYHLGALMKSEIRPYIAHRLYVAGGHGTIFPSSVIDRIHSYTNGIPRLINLLCDRALLGVYAEGKEKVDGSVLGKAADEVFGRKRYGNGRLMVSRWALTGILAALFSIGFSGNVNTMQQSPQIRLSAISFNAGSGAPSGEHGNAGLMDSMKGVLESESRERAFRELFSLWKLPYFDGLPSEICERSADIGIECLSGRGGIEALRQLNRPAVLGLRNNSYATLRSLNDSSALIGTVVGTRQIGLDELEAIWTGSYTAIVRVPLKYDGTIHKWTKGEAVQWIERNIALIRGRAERPEIDSYDSLLEAEVRQFQEREGIFPDGIVGPKTIAHLNTVVVSRDPVLQLKEKGI